MIYLQIPNLKGGVTDGKFAGCSEILYTTLGVSCPANMNTGATYNRSKSRPSFSEIAIIKELDSMSTPLFDYVHSHQLISEANIYHCDNSGDYLSYGLSNILITNRSIDCVGKLRPFEYLTLNYTKIQENYIPRDSSNREGSPLRSGYDISKVC